MSVPYRTMIVAAMLLLNSVSQASADTASDREIFTRRFPNLTIDRFEPSPIPGLYQITSQHQILYASTSGHMLIGDLWSPEGENLSARSRDRLLITQVDSLSSSASITIGTGPLSVIEISDPDCPHCRILDRFLDQQEDLKRTIHYLPHTSIHPQALQKVAHILRAQDPVAAHKAVMNGALDSTPPSPVSQEERERIEEAVKALIAKGINATPILIVDGQIIRGADLPRITSLLTTLRSQQKQTTRKGVSP